MDKTVGYN